MTLLLLVVQLVVLLLVFVHAWADFIVAPRLATGGSGAHLPPVTILIPARNEQANIAGCVASVLAQDYPAFAVVVVDDGSEDGTAAIVQQFAARDSRLTLLPCPPRPAGWCGKSWALASGVAQAGRQPSFYCFIDADVQVEPAVLRRTMEHCLKNRLSMVSLLPALTTLTFWEKVIQPVMAMLMFVAQPLRLINRTESALAVANGQYLLVDRQAYEQIGGHAAIAGEIVEDVALARAFKREGLAVSLVVATDQMRTRMYTDLAALWQGWGKTIHPYLRRQPALVWLGVSTVLLLMGLPFVTLGFAVSHSLVAGLVNMASVLVIFGNALLFRRVSGQQLAHGLLWPLGLAMLVALFAVRTVGAWRGQPVYWKGRRYS